jgi:hypothetical protein
MMFRARFGKEIVAEFLPPVRVRKSLSKHLAERVGLRYLVVPGLRRE